MVIRNTTRVMLQLTRIIWQIDKVCDKFQLRMGNSTMNIVINRMDCTAITKTDESVGRFNWGVP